MHRLLAGLAALVAVLGLCLVSVGTANAATPVRSGLGDILCTGVAGAVGANCTQNGSPFTFPTGTGAFGACTIPTGATQCELEPNGTPEGTDHPVSGLVGGLRNRLGGVVGNGLGGVGPSVICPGGGRVDLFGHCLPLPGAPQIFCAQGFVRVGDHCVPGGVNPGGPIVGGCGSCGGVPVAIPPNLVLVNGHFVNLGNWGLSGAGTVDVCSFADWNGFDGFAVNRFGASRWSPLRSRFGTNPFAVWNALRARAACSGSGQVIVGQQPTLVSPGCPSACQAPAQAPVAQAPVAQAPVSSAPQATAPATQAPAQAPVAAAPSGGGGNVPSGSVETGGDSPLTVLLAPWI